MPSVTTLFVSFFFITATLVAAVPAPAGNPTKFKGFHAPAGLADGVYQVTLDSTGQEVHTLLSSDLGSRSVSPAPVSLLERQTPSAQYCHCDQHLNHANTDTAVGLLKNQVGSGTRIPYNSGWYSIYGGVMTFICTYGTIAGVYVRASDIDSENTVITAVCGSYVAGYYWDGVWGSSNSMHQYNYGYMNYNSGNGFCAAAVNGATGRC